MQLHLHTFEQYFENSQSTALDTEMELLLVSEV